jgi:hypothetical protein
MLIDDEANQDRESRGDRLRLRTGCGRVSEGIRTLIEGDLREMRGSKSEDIRPAHMRGWSLRRPRFLVYGGCWRHAAHVPKVLSVKPHRDCLKKLGPVFSNTRPVCTVAWRLVAARLPTAKHRLHALKTETNKLARYEINVLSLTELQFLVHLQYNEPHL